MKRQFTLHLGLMCSTQRFLGEAPEQRPGFGLQRSPDRPAAAVAAARGCQQSRFVVRIHILRFHLWRRRRRWRRRQHEHDMMENLLEVGFVAGDGEGAHIVKPVFLLGPVQQLPEHRVVQVRRADNIPPGGRPHADRDVSLRHVGRRRRRLRRRWEGCTDLPPEEDLVQPYYVSDFGAFGHF